jgi:integrase
MAKKRAHGVGTVFKDSRTGMYRYQWTDTTTGKKRTKSLGTKDRAEAERKAGAYTKMQEASDRDEAMLHIAKSRKLVHVGDVPLDEAWATFLATDPTTSAGTLANYRRNLAHFVTWIKEYRPGMVGMADVDHEAARAYLETLWKTGIAAATFNQRRMSLARIAKAVAEKHGTGNPWADTKPRPVAEQQRLPLDAGQVAGLGDVFRNPDITIPYRDEMRMLFLVCIYVGTRLCDAVNLKWEDVDLVAGRIDYTPAKTAGKAKRAAVPILPPLASALFEWRADVPTDCPLVLPQIAAHYARNPDYIKRACLDVLHRVTGTGREHNAGVKAQYKVRRSAYGMHSLRHTFGTNIAAAGVPVAYLSSMMGDNITTVQKYYTHVGFAMELVEGFGTITNMIEAKQGADPERAKLHRLADELPLSAVREVLALITGGEGPSPVRGILAMVESGATLGE